MNRSGHHTIKVQERDFDVSKEYKSLVLAELTGAVVVFVGRVRDFASNDKTFLLQHYPGMTEKVLLNIVKDAQRRWPLLATRIIHRVGALSIDDQIVFVGVSAAHRKDAFNACEFIIDILKTEAPFWKKEGTQWVAADNNDQVVADTWKAK